MSNAVLIFNPAAGMNDPVSPDMLREKGFEGEIIIADHPGDVYKIAGRLSAEATVLAVYGGDGTVTEAARALYKRNTSLAIIPGGTANIIAKELNIPAKPEEALELLRSGHQVKRIDMGVVNGFPFLIRVNMGIFADMVTGADPELKERWGQLAYGLAAFQTLGREPITFQLSIDGRSFVEEAVALTVTNAGNVGKSGFSFLPDISMDDGWLDVITLDKANLVSLMRVTGSILLQKNSETFRHWRAKEILIRFDPDSPWLRDDAEGTGNRLKIEVVPSALRVIVPEDPE
ncbi:MAG TPA: diacylglycerol kinase family protein [Puia sp.]|jgi:YegS/Rv2252/BmrU family lipid kinase|nr:diacylglycerol kinase family protein [Puia sp.]